MQVGSDAGIVRCLERERRQGNGKAVAYRWRGGRPYGRSDKRAQEDLVAFATRARKKWYDSEGLSDVRRWPWPQQMLSMDVTEADCDDVARSLGHEHRCVQPQ